jgi:hypothetical protein
MHLDALPTAPQAVQESGSLERKRSPQSSSGHPFPLVTVCQRVPEPPGEPRLRVDRAGRNRRDVQSDESRQPPPSRTLFSGRRLLG